MTAHIVLNLLNELWKRDKMRGLPSSKSLFRNEFNKLKNTGVRQLDSIYLMILKLIWPEKVNILPSLRNVIMDVTTLRY